MSLSRTSPPPTSSPTTPPSPLLPPMHPKTPSLFSAHAFASRDSTSGSPQPPRGGQNPPHFPIGNPSASPAAFLFGGWMSDPTPFLPKPGSNRTPSAPPKAATSVRKSFPVFVVLATSIATFAFWGRPVPPLKEWGSAQTQTEWLPEK